MSADQLRDPHQAPPGLLDLYIKQLFEHLDERRFWAVRERIPSAYDWALATPDSYQIWLSYAAIDISANTRGVQLTTGKTTRSTSEQMDFLNMATQDDLQEYHDWALVDTIVGRPGRGQYSTGLISPVHFWFFTFCRRRAFTIQPTSPHPSNTFFPHPLYLIRYKDREPPLVAPQYFFEQDARFDRLDGQRTSPCFIFPCFARRLFEYARKSAGAEPVTESFIRYYSTREEAFFIQAGVDVDHIIEPPHQILKRHWRWEEVLEMLRGYQGPRGPKHRIYWDAPRGYNQNRGMADYFDRFAEMAIDWWRRSHVPLVQDTRYITSSV